MVRDSDITQTADVPLVNSSLVTDRDSERITIYGQYEGAGLPALTHLRASCLPYKALLEPDHTNRERNRQRDRLSERH